MLEVCRTDRARIIIDNLLNQGEASRSFLIAKVGIELKGVGTTNVVGSLLDRGCKSGKYLKVGKGVYALNPSYVDVKKDSYSSDIVVSSLDKADIVVKKELSSMSDSLVEGYLDDDIDKVALDKYKVLKNISLVVNSCIAYYKSGDIVEFKKVLNKLK